MSIEIKLNEHENQKKFQLFAQINENISNLPEEILQNFKVKKEN